MERCKRIDILYISKNAEKCAYSRYLRRRYSRERASQSLEVIQIILSFASLGNARVELSANRQELAEVVQYIADLRPSCDDIRSTFEERQRRRQVLVERARARPGTRQFGCASAS